MESRSAQQALWKKAVRCTSAVVSAILVVVVIGLLCNLLAGGALVNMPVFYETIPENIKFSKNQNLEICIGTFSMRRIWLYGHI